MDNSIQPPQPPQLNTKKGKIAQFFGELSKSRRIALIVVVLIATLGAGWLVFSKADANPNAIASRDVYQWPLSKYSFWNMPIGQNAQFSNEPVLSSGESGINEDITPITMDPNAPIKTGNFVGNQVQVRVSPANHWPGGDTWNGMFAFLTPDNRSFVQGQVLGLEQGGNPTANYCYVGAISLTSEGAEGCHGGSGLSGLGGTLRTSDLADPNKPIKHALNIGLFCNQDCDNGGGGFRWPAVKADSYAFSGAEGCGRYNGAGGAKAGVHMGSLLALPPNFDVTKYPKGSTSRQIADALKNYGAYATDDSCWNAVHIGTEQGARSVEGSLGDIQEMWRNLHLVSNNSPNSIGGGGAPINDADGYPLCYAPDFSNAGFTDEIATNPNGVTDDPSCHGGTVQPPTPPPAPECPEGQVKDASGNCVPESSGNGNKGSVAFYGDSLTGDDYWKGYIKNGLAEDIKAAGFTDVTAKGCGGMTMAQFVGAAGAENFCTDNTLEAHKADIAKSNTVVVAFYSNDESSKEEFKANAQTAINKIKEYNPNVKNIVFIKGYFSGNEAYNEAFNELASTDPNIVKVIDISGAFGGNYDSNCSDASNQFHPTDDCWGKMSKEIANKLKTVVGSVTPPPTQPCPAGQTRNASGNCVDNPTPDPECQDGKVLIDGECKTPDPVCQNGQVLVNGECKDRDGNDDCTGGKVKVNGQCVAPDPVCQNGQVRVNGQCVTPTTTCPAGQTRNANGNCVTNTNPTPTCPAGQTKVNGQCKPEVSTQEYKPAGTYDDNVAVYSSGWEIGGDSPKYIHFNGSDHYTNRANETMTFKFNGNNVKIYGANDPNMGTAKVTIDGGTETIVNYYGPVRKDQVLIYDSGDLPDGNHTVVLKATGQNNKQATITTASFNYNRQLATDGHDPEAETYISVDKIVVASKAVTSDNCPNGQVKVDGVCKTPDPGGNCPNGQVKVDGKCVTPEITCPANQSVVNGECKDSEGKGGGTTTQEKKVDTEVSKKPEAKTVAEKLVNTGRFLLLPAIVAVLIILVAGGLYVVTKKKK